MVDNRSKHRAQVLDVKIKALRAQIKQLTDKKKQFEQDAAGDEPRAED